MISIEDELFTLIATALRAAYSGIYVSGEYVSQPPQFPAVSIVEEDNTEYTPGIDSSGKENYASVMYQVDVYSNLNRGKKVQAKAIIGMIDSIFKAYGFTRTYMNPTKNSDPNIYRMTGRYRAVVSKDEVIYRR